MNHEQSMQRRLDIATAIESGLSPITVANRFGVSRGLVDRATVEFLGSRQCKLIKALRTRAVLSEMASLGISQKKAADILGVAYPVLSQMAKRHAVKFRHGLTRDGIDPRAEAMASLYRAGRTLEQIGTEYGLTRERVRQIMTKDLGLSREDGGAVAQAKRTREMQRQARDQKSWAKHGCTYLDYRYLVSLGKPTRAYASQKRNAATRGISWEMNLWQWWTIWQQSGKWAERGSHGDAFVMCRKDDKGPYAPSNVYIATLRHNSSVQPNNPYRSSHPDHGTIVFKSRTGQKGRSNHSVHAGLPKGVTLHKSSGRFMAQARIGGRNTYLGMFPDPQAAHEAYLAAVNAEMARAA